MEAISALVNFVHMSSTTAWIGAILFMAIIMGPIFKKTGKEKLREILESIFKRFRLLSIICIILMILSGILLTAREGAADVSLGTAYGMLFLLKHIIMIIIAAAVFASKYYLFPKINTLCSSSESQESLCKYQRGMLTVLSVSAALGLGVLLITAFMQAL